MKKFIVTSIVLAASFSVFAHLNVESSSVKTNDQSAAEISHPAENKKAADFTLKSTDGKDVRLADYKGKIVLLDFWATWCAPCRKGIPDLVQLQNEYKKDLIVIGISVDRQTKDDVIPFMKKYGVNYPVVYYTDKVVMDYGNIQAIPTSFLIDKKGNIYNSHVGLVPKSIYEKEIKEILGK